MGEGAFRGDKEVAIEVRAVNISMGSEYYDQTKLGRYGKNGYLHNIDQPTNPETGEITPVLLIIIPIKFYRIADCFWDCR